MNFDQNFDRFTPLPVTGKQDLGFWWHVLKAWFFDRMRSPLFATVTLFTAGAAFAVIVMMSYPDGGPHSNALPVIKADSKPFKEAPEDAGGMAVPHRDSTVFQAMQGDEFENRPIIENLLAPEETMPEENIRDITDKTEPIPVADLLEPDTTSVKSDEENAKDNKSDSDTNEKTPALAPVPAPLETVRAPEKKPEAIHPAGSSPETIAFVRSILEKEETQKNKTPSAVAGNNYVQLGSVKNEAGAKTEWRALQKAFPQIQGLPYRVQKANLGDKGTFYRIQAGPMSADRADSLCRAVKAQKPGGCLVVR